MQKHFILAGLMIATASAHVFAGTCQARKTAAVNQEESNEKQKKDEEVSTNDGQSSYISYDAPQNNHIQTWSEYFSNLKTRLYVRYILAKDSCADTMVAAKRKVILCFSVLKDIIVGG
jgi:hypothetical protein